MIDERIEYDVRSIHSIGYWLYWWGVFGVLLYRWFSQGQSLWDTLDIVTVWFISSLVTFVMSAKRGVPVTYPLRIAREVQTVFLIVVPTITAGITLGMLAVAGRIGDASHGAIIFILTWVIVLVIQYIYVYLYKRWKKQVDEEGVN